MKPLLPRENIYKRYELFFINVTNSLLVSCLFFVFRANVAGVVPLYRLNSLLKWD